MNRRKQPLQTASHATQKKPRRVKISKNLAPPLMAHLGYQGARHLHPQRLPTKSAEKTVSVRLLDLGNETIENVQKIAETVKRLMVPGLCLKSIPENLTDRLVVLEKLDLSNNQLSDGSLPESMKRLEHLVELNLNTNNFTKVPPALKKLKSLSRLDLSENSIDSLNGLDKLRKIQILVVDNNKLTSVFKEVCHLKRLEIFRCRNNYVKDIGVEIRQMKQLRDLDISNNKLSILPTDVLLLPSLETLNASRNKITKIPAFNIKLHNRHYVSEIDLSDNQITVFPGHLLRMTEKLDLSSNQIKILNMNAMKELERNPNQELIVDDNPLVFPPAEITGQNAILAYIQEARLNTPVYRGMKILVIGSHRSGKSSLIQSMVDNQARLAEDLNESVAGIDLYDLVLDCEMKVKNEEDGKMQKEIRPLQLCLWDFCGHPYYQFPHYLFFEQPSVALLTFNMKEFTPQKFNDMIGCWLDWMIAKTNSLKVVLVGTQCDKMSKEKIKEVKAEVKKQMTEFKNYHESILNERINHISQKSEISPTLTERMFSYRKLLIFTDTFTVQSDVIATSSAEFVGFDQLRKSIELIAKDENQFPPTPEYNLPLVLHKVKTFWVDVENYLDEKSNSMVVPIMPWDEYVEEVTTKFGMKKQIKDITQYLHVTGKVLWFSTAPVLCNYVFIRPAWLFELLRNIYRHDFEEKVDFATDDTYKQMGFSQTRFDRNKRELLQQGVMDKDFLRAIVGYLIPPDMKEQFNFMLDILLRGFKIGYPAAKKTKEMTYNLSPEIENVDNVSKILIPWIRNTEEPEEVTSLWEDHHDRERVAALLRFPKYMPPGLFELLCVGAQKVEKHNLTFKAHWSNGILARHNKIDAVLMISYTNGPKGKGASLKYELRDDSPDPMYYPTRPAAMWTILLPLLQDFEEIIKSFKGVLVERQMLCKFCQNPSFLGEWNTPKETQNLPEKICEVCNEKVDTDTLVQQREEKRGNFSHIEGWVNGHAMIEFFL